jgi:hypothetical protein
MIENVLQNGTEMWRNSGGTESRSGCVRGGGGGLQVALFLFHRETCWEVLLGVPT